MTRLKVGLLGLGRHGSRYARHLAEGHIKHGELAAVWRRDSAKGARQARELGVPFEPDWAELVARSDVEVVAAVVPPGLHLEVTRLCAEFGKPLIVDKPLAPTVPDGRRMSALMKNKRLPFMVAQTLRFANAIVRLKEAILSHPPLFSLHIAQHLDPRNLEWETRPEHGAGGILHQTGIHAADLVRFLSEREVAAVSCRTRRVHNPRLPDVASATLEMDDGVLIAHFQVSKAGSGRHCWAEAVTSGGVVGADYLRGRLMLRKGSRTWRKVADNPTVLSALEGFCRAVLRNTPVPVPAEEGLRSLMVVEACRKSAEGQGRRVVVSAEMLSTG